MAGDLPPDALNSIRQLMRLVEENGLSELTVSESSGFSVTVKSASADTEISSSTLPVPSVRPLPHRSVPAALPTPQTRLALGKLEPKGRSAKAVAMGSPMVGIYYEAPAPGEPAFVQVGDTIQIGTIIGLIEAMKVYSEIPSEVAGQVVELAAKNGVLVQQGEPLLYVEPSS